MNNKSIQKQSKKIKKSIQDFAQKNFKNQEQALSILGITMLIIISVMFIKVQPEYLKASFFSRFFPKAEINNTEERDESESDPKAELGFYTFADLQAKYFDVPKTKNLNKALNYENTPATFSRFQDSFISLWEQNLEKMNTSSQHMIEFDEQFNRIQNQIVETHSVIQPKVNALAVKVCKKQDASGPDCE
jgi:uncharacterized protein involved in tolerance to divalent cations